MRGTQLLNAAARFHGHLGPWVALGVRAGERAADLLSDNPFRLQAHVRCPRKTPYTCFIDGVQFGSGCTLGKGNIRQSRDRRVSVEFRLLAESDEPFVPGEPPPPKSVLRLELSPEAWTELHLNPAKSKAALEKFAREVFRRPLDELFLERLETVR